MIPVHLYGNVAEMDAIVVAASERGLDVVEDAAEAAFSRHRGRCAGTIGRVGTFSFHATKTITTGEGGMVVTADDALAARCRTLRDHGMRKDKRYWHDVVGYNFRLTNLQAAIGCGQLEALDRIIAERRTIHDGYKAALRRGRDQPAAFRQTRGASRLGHGGSTRGRRRSRRRARSTDGSWPGWRMMGSRRVQVSTI